MQIDDHRQPTPPLTFGDLKPGNVFRWVNGQDTYVKVSPDHWFDWTVPFLLSEQRPADLARLDSLPVIRLDAELVIRGEG